MNQTCAQVDASVDEFELAGLTKGESRTVRAPHVAESGVVMECRKTQIIQLQGSNGELCDTWMVFGEVTGVKIKTSLIEDGIFKTGRAEPLLRAGGAGDYYTIDSENLFEMLRPR